MRLSVRLALFVTCLVDTLLPQVGQATVRFLARLGCEVAFPAGQTCCGQMHLNAGYASEGTTLARRFAGVFDGTAA
jgi:L-lactate dehydrogenase complex protein LldE